MSITGFNRREFLEAAATAGFGVAAAPAGVQRPSGPGRVPPVRYGEPCELLGKRLYFLNWQYIRPGIWTWRDASGQKVKTEDSVAPGAAHLTHTDRPFGVELVAQPAQRIGPLIEPEAAWEEGAGVALTTMIKDGGMFRGWQVPFTFSGDPPGMNHCYYLESSDGFAWKRPKLGIVDLHGSRDNNLVNITDCDGGCVFIDPSAPASERYKMIAEGHFPREICEEYLKRRPDEWDPKVRRESDGGAKGVKGAVSPDGVHWTMLRDPLVMEVTDTQLTASYDQRLRKYVAYTRTWIVGRRFGPPVPENDRVWMAGRRSIGRSESADFRSFPLHETILEPGLELLPSDTLYTNCKTIMPGAPDQHVMFPTIWHTANDSTSVSLASSHDGKVWHFLAGAPVFTTGSFGAFDGGCVFAHPNLLEMPDGRFVLPYTGYNVPHKYPRRLWKFAPGYAVWPKGRLVALQAKERGEFATVGMIPPGRKVRLNATTRRGGSILVEVAGIKGEPLSGRSFADARPISGDHHWTTLNWGGTEDLGHQDNTGVVLRFRLDQAEIYGLEFV